jgi:dTDP-L-rhamnose 4-epimerase
VDVLITGGAGFIGSATARALVSRGHQVTVLDNFSRQIHTEDREKSFTWQSIRSMVNLVEGDVRDVGLLRSWVPRFDAVLHLAAETGTGQSMYEVAHYCDVNLMGTAQLLQVLGSHRGRVRNLVVASSRSIYGEGRYECDQHGSVYPFGRGATDIERGTFECSCPICGEVAEFRPTHEESIPRPASIYAVTKLAQEQLCLVSAQANGYSATVLRYQNVYGEGQSLQNPYTGILAIFSREILAGREIEIFEDGLESRDFVHVEDVANVNVAVLERPAEGTQVLNVGSGVATTVLAVAETLAAYYGRTDLRLRISGRFRSGDIRHNCADLSRLIAATAYRPSITFAQGIARFGDWVRDQLAGAGSGSKTYADAMAELETRGLMVRPQEKS